MRHRYANAPAPPNPVTQTPAFKAWFGNSRVVNDRGDPLVVYSGRPDIRDLFGAIPDGPRSHYGAWFASDDVRCAESYTDPHRALDYQAADPGVVPLYLSIQNPLVIDAEFKHWRNTAFHVERAREAGHDGVIIRNSVDHYASRRDKPPKRSEASTVYVWFKPGQAKSALTAPMRSRYGQREPLEYTGPNRGAFDPENPDIRGNPYRRVAGKRTRTWLPADAGKFDENSRLEWRRGKRWDDIETWRMSPRQVERARSPKLVLPDGREAALKPLGSGQFTTAYMGSDKWVYLLTREESGKRDMSKDILAALASEDENKTFSRHFPWVECIGHVEVPRRGLFRVYRMPRYMKLDSRNARTAHKIRKIDLTAWNELVARKAEEMADKTGVPVEEVTVTDVDLSSSEIRAAAVDSLLRGLTGSPAERSIAQALVRMAEVAADLGPGWVFEFPIRNIMQDADGNIVLLDVLLDRDEFVKQNAERKKQEKSEARANPIEKFLPREFIRVPGLDAQRKAADTITKTLAYAEAAHRAATEAARKAEQYKRAMMYEMLYSHEERFPGVT